MGSIVYLCSLVVNTIIMQKEMLLGDQVRAIVNSMKGGGITYAEARKQAQPILDKMNLIMKLRCKENCMRFKKVIFEAFAR